MKFFSKTFYLLIISLLVVLFFIVPNIKYKQIYVAKNSITINENLKNNNTINQNIITPVNPNDNKNTTIVLSDLDKKILATLVKEDLPANVSDLKLVHLNVPIFHQQYSRSCEEASLRMVLAFYGIDSDDMEIVEKVGYDPKPWDMKNNIWDDPNKMFVGFIDDSNKSGYGAFSPAIAKAAKAFGLDANNYLGVTSQFLAQQIYAGHPVIVWGLYATPPFMKYSWKTEEGQKVAAYRGEHARVVVGVYGDLSNPVGFLLNDPLTGEKDQYWSAARLTAHMNIFGNLTNQAVVAE